MLVRFNVGTLKDVVDLDEIYLRNACKSPASNLTCLTLRSYHCRSNDQNFQNDPRMHYSKILKATALFDMVYEIKLNIEVGRLTYCIIYTLIARTSFIKQDCVRGGSTVMHAYLLLHIRASSREKPYFVVCEQQRHRPACASAQSVQFLSYSLSRKYVRYVPWYTTNV